MVPIHGWGLIVSRLQSHYAETVYFLPLSSQELLVVHRNGNRICRSLSSTIQNQKIKPGSTEVPTFSNNHNCFFNDLHIQMPFTFNLEKHSSNLEILLVAIYPTSSSVIS